MFSKAKKTKHFLKNKKDQISHSQSPVDKILAYGFTEK